MSSLPPAAPPPPPGPPPSGPPPSGPVRGYWTGGRTLGAVAALIAAFGVGAVCGVATAHAPSSAPAAVSNPAAGTPPAAPAPAPTPVVLSGQGSKVLELDLAKGSYRLSWSAQGHDNFAVHLEGSESSLLVNEIPPSPASGETFVRIGGGHYALDVRASTLTWSITLTPL